MTRLRRVNRHEPGRCLRDLRHPIIDAGRVRDRRNMTAYDPRLVDTAPDVRYLHRGRASLDALGARHHPGRRMAPRTRLRGRSGGRTCLFRSDGDLLPLRDLRRGRRRRRAREASKSSAGQAPRLENAASQVTERFLACFAARDWDAFTEILADDISTDDRRRVVNAGIRHGRDAEIQDLRSAADLGVTNLTSDVIATRGERLVLIRSRLSRPR